jgi:hypothetical protein
LTSSLPAALHFTSLHFTSGCTSLHFTSLHFRLHFTSLHFTSPHFTSLHFHSTQPSRAALQRLPCSEPHCIINCHYHYCAPCL